MKIFPNNLRKEFEIFKRLDSPSKVQDFIEKIIFNFEYERICHSPRMVLKTNRASCIEASMLAVAIFWYHSEESFLLDLKTKNDIDHVVTLFKRNGLWGAISKSNHAFLRYRDPIYKTVHELIMSYFNEYFLDNGKKTLRTYSQPYSLIKNNSEWLTANSCWNVIESLDRSPHFKIFKNGNDKFLRLADPIEQKVGKLMILKPKSATRRF